MSPVRFIKYLEKNILDAAEYDDRLCYHVFSVFVKHPHNSHSRSIVLLPQDMRTMDDSIAYPAEVLAILQNFPCNAQYAARAAIHQAG